MAPDPEKPVQVVTTWMKCYCNSSSWLRLFIYSRDSQRKIFFFSTAPLTPKYR